ncbi:MAG: hypothetical protein J6J87_02830 [Oscillospiraceae bacterium]|nr:hypothetical protein [Oscillospiraceae bacterium]
MRGRKQPTRRRRALRWLALLVLLGAFLTLHGQYHFLLIQGIREAERLGGIGPTRLVTELPGDEHRQVRANKKGMMVASFRIMSDGLKAGWGAWHSSYLDCSGSEPFYAGFCIYDNHLSAIDEDYMMWADCYGRINDPAAAAVRIDVYKDGALRESHTVLKKDWIQVNGYTYFALEFEWEELCPGVLRSQLLDEKGNLLYCREFTLTGSAFRDLLRLSPLYQ